jgi:preprotein translocase subunit SecA
MLSVNAVDVHWQDHLTEMDELDVVLGSVDMAKKIPLSEYKNEAFSCF